MNSPTLDDFARGRLVLWHRRCQEAADRLVSSGGEAADEPLTSALDQLTTVQNLAVGLVSDLRQSAGTRFGTSRVGRKYMSQAGRALAHVGTALAHMTTSVHRLVDLLGQPQSTTGASAGVEARLRVQLARDAAARSLRRAAQAVTLAADSRQSEHARAERPRSQPTRRRP
ncbi:hypothetical protein [Streptomyces sp. NPDC003435]